MSGVTPAAIDAMHWKPNLTSVAGLAAVVLVAAVVAYAMLSRPTPLPEGLIQANGRIEGDHVIVASKVPGRIAKLSVREGDTVVPGQVLALIDDAAAQARVNQARAALATLDAQARAGRTALAVATREVPLDIDRMRAGVERAHASIAKAQAIHAQASREVERMRMLVAKGFVTAQRVEQSELVLAEASAESISARSAAIQAEQQLAEARLGPDRIRAREAEVAAIEAQRDQARAALAEAESLLADLTITAPTGGVIMTRVRDIGEIVAAGSPIFDLVDLDRLYLKAYVPEVLIGKLRLNAPARIYTDAFPELAVPASVKFIASRAEFTPKEVQTQDERVKLTYAVKLYLEHNPDRRLTPGLPADAMIQWKEGIAWVRPRG